MTKSEKRLIAIELIMSLVFLLNILVKNIINEYIVFFTICMALGLIIFLMGYEKDQNLDNNTKKKLLLYVGIYCVGFIILEFGLGLILDYIKTPYKRDLLNILNNILSITIIIISSEFLRYMLVKKGEKQKIILILAFILFVLLDLTLNAKYYNLDNLSELLKYGTIVFLPSIFKNYILTKFAHQYGISQNILYRLILELYIYIVPFTPDLGIYLESVLLMAFPLLLNGIITIGFEKEKKKDFRKSKLKKRVITTTIVLIVSIIVALNSNLFRFWVAAIGSGSMEPTINIGDVIVVDKYYQNHLDKLKEGDILVFKIGKKIYTHRIIGIEEKNGNYYFKTKGDRKGQIEDSWTVTNKDVIGIVKFKIKYIGYPTVWLSEILEESK